MPTALASWTFLTAVALGGSLGLGALFSGDAAALDGDADAAGVDDDGDGEDADASDDGWCSLLGVGRVPLGLLLSLDLMLFGGIGIVSTDLLAALVPESLAALGAVALALVFGPFAGARLARVIARVLPSVESHGATRDALVGRLGRAELRIDDRFGRARVRDAGGAEHLVRCTSETRVIDAGSTLVVVGHDRRTGVYRVERADLLAAHGNPH